jgi:hypothetical protein
MQHTTIIGIIILCIIMAEPLGIIYEGILWFVFGIRLAKSGDRKQQHAAPKGKA